MKEYLKEGGWKSWLRKERVNTGCTYHTIPTHRKHFLVPGGGGFSTGTPSGRCSPLPAKPTPVGLLETNQPARAKLPALR